MTDLSLENRAVMAQERWSQRSITLFFTLVAELTVGLSWCFPAQAQFNPPNLGAPKTTAGGGSRWDTNSPSCIPGEKSRALVPYNKVGLTTQARPTFFLYLSNTNAQLAEFMLLDINEKNVYQTTISIPRKASVVSFQLPPESPSLKINQYYQWYFKVICQPNDRRKDEFVAGWIRRVQPNSDLLNTLKSSPPRQHPNVYAQAGIWQDTLTTLAELRRTRSADATVIDEWNRLLKSVGLENIPGESPIKQLSSTAFNAR